MYFRTLGNISQTTWIIPPTIIYIQCEGAGGGGTFTVSNTLVGKGDLLSIHTQDSLLVA